MKDDNIRDERIVFERRKIQSDAYQILIYCLLISIVIQQFILNAPFSQFAVEFFCLIGMGIYMTIRHLTIGIDIFNSTRNSNKKILINGLTSGVISVVPLAILAKEKNIWNLIIFIVVFSSLYFIAHVALRFINEKKQKQINQRMNVDEMD